MKPSDIEQEDIDFDKLFDQELPFKPLTRGLGFHHEAKEEQALGTLKARSNDLKRSLNDRASNLQKNREASPLSNKDMGDLAPFYSSKPKERVEPIISSEAPAPRSANSRSTSQKSARIDLRFLAFSIDIAIILSALVVTFLSILISSGISLMVIRENLSVEFAAAYIMPISLLFYFFYFSFFDKTNFSSPGKKVMGIRVVSESSGEVTMSQAFLRSLVVIASAVTAGLMSALDFQGRLTDTKVIKRR